jgi:NADPH:quinone reductase-like Zn-dependent oxidoreductase
VRNLGADKVIDYKKEDFTKNNEKYDIILDTIGKTPVGRSKKMLKKGGTYVFTTFGVPKLLQILWLRLINRKKAIFGLVEDDPVNLIFLKELVETGKIKSVIDKRYPLEQAADAHAYVESGQKKGQVVINVVDSL